MEAMSYSEEEFPKFNESADNYEKDVVTIMKSQDLIYPEESGELLKYIRG